jgi:hypothetical protein
VRIASRLPPGSRLVCLELSAEYASIAAQVINHAGLSDMVTILIGPAGEGVGRLAQELHIASVDLLFIDHDKDRCVVVDFFFFSLSLSLFLTPSFCFLQDFLGVDNRGLLVEGRVVVAGIVVFPGVCVCVCVCVMGGGSP